MAEFKIITDSTADLPDEYLAEHDIACMNLCYIIGGETYGGATGKELPWKEFYARMRNGEMPTTAQVNPEEAKEHFRRYILEGHKKILYHNDNRTAHLPADSQLCIMTHCIRLDMVCPIRTLPVQKRKRPQIRLQQMGWIFV